MSCLGNRYLKIWLPHECSCELLHPSKIDKNLPYIAAEAPHDGHSTEIQDSQKQVPDQSHFSLDGRLMGQGKRRERAKHGSGDPDRAGAGMEPCHG